MKSSHSPKILLVEDDAVLSEMYQLRLQAEDFEVARAQNGREALKEIPHFKPDVILLDIMMPEMNGFEVLHYLRGQKETEKIPVLILTALSQQKDREMGMEAGANDYIVKSETMPHDIVDKVKDAVKIHGIVKNPKDK